MEIVTKESVGISPTYGQAEKEKENVMSSRSYLLRVLAQVRAG